MIGPVNPEAHINFSLDKLSPNSEGFFNSKGFIDNELKTLASQASREDKEIIKGLHEIRAAINGET